MQRKKAVNHPFNVAGDEHKGQEGTSPAQSCQKISKTPKTTTTEG